MTTHEIPPLGSGLTPCCHRSPFNLPHADRMTREVEQVDCLADLASAWADYRKDYGVNSGDMMTAHKAFTAGWKAAREGDQAGVLR